MSYRMEAEANRGLYFDHLGAREISSGVEIWLSLRSGNGEIVRISAQFQGDEVVPSVADLWAGAAWCEREAAEAFAITFDQPTPLLLLSREGDRGYLKKAVRLEERERPWPGSFDPAGKTMKPLGAE